MHCLGLRGDNVEVIPDRHRALSVDIPLTGKETAAAISSMDNSWLGSARSERRYDVVKLHSNQTLTSRSNDEG
jgi:hypothetical protein